MDAPPLGQLGTEAALGEPSARAAAESIVKCLVERAACARQAVGQGRRIRGQVDPRARSGPGVGGARSSSSAMHSLIAAMSSAALSDGVRLLAGVGEADPALAVEHDLAVLPRAPADADPSLQQRELVDPGRRSDWHRESRRVSRARLRARRRQPVRARSSSSSPPARTTAAAAPEASKRDARSNSACRRSIAVSSRRRSAWIQPPRPPTRQNGALPMGDERLRSRQTVAESPT